MKINGRIISGPNEATLVIPRNNDSDIVIKARAILDMSVFENICPEPQAPTLRHRSGEVTKDFKDKKYLEAVDKHAQLRMDYMVIESLKATEGLEWDKVDSNNPETWGLWRDEFKNAGLSFHEVQRIVALVFEANSLDDNKFKEARDRFTLSQAQQLLESSSQKDGQVNTPSGELAKD